MLSSRYVFLLIAILTILLTMVPGRADKPKPKLLDGELIEEGQTTPPRNRPAGAGKPHQPDRHLRQEFSVRLPSNPSTGFGWKVASYDREFLRLLRNRYQKPEQPRPGAGGQELFDFLSLKSGSTTIVFHYRRPLKTMAGDRPTRS